MLRLKTSLLTLGALAVFVALAQPVAAGCGCGSPVTTAYAPVVSYAAPAYMPGVVYRAMYQPAPVAVYSPGVAYGGYAMTTYRPVYRWNSPRLVPYTTYRPYYAAAPVVSYSAFYSPTYSSCQTCNTCPTYNACDTGNCGTVTYSTPTTSGCASCAAGATVVAPQPATNGVPAPTLNPAPQSVAPQRTFEENVQKPATTPELKPIPQTETRLNSTPSPLLPDPQDRTAARTTYTATTVGYAATPALSTETLSNDGWQPARD